MRTDADFIGDARLHLVIAKGEHPAVRVMDQDDLVGAEQPLGDRQGANGVIGGDPAGVADDVSIAFLQAQNLVDMQAGIHAGEDGQLLRRWQRQRPFVERTSIGLVVLQQLVSHAHGDTSTDIVDLVDHNSHQLLLANHTQMRPRRQISGRPTGGRRSARPPAARSTSSVCIVSTSAASDQSTTSTFASPLRSQ